MTQLKLLPLGQVSNPFDNPDWIFELKLDGFRALARVQDGRAELISRRGLLLGLGLEIAEQMAGAPRARPP